MPDPDVEPAVDASLVRRLIAAQFPQWAELPVRAVEPGGWDNITFRLGEEMTVRLPRDLAHSPQAQKEHRWLPYLAPQLPLQVPVPLARGSPGDGYPYHWTVNRWIEGETAWVGRIDDEVQFATSLAEFLVALRGIDPTGGPAAGPHSFFRGGPLATYDDETRRAVRSLDAQIPADLATMVWEAALAASWHSSPVWFHGDVDAGNLLVRDGRLAAVIDFGCCGVGDPACDTTIAWTFIEGDAREAFRTSYPADGAMWARGRGWALWKALITIAGQTGSDPSPADQARLVLDRVLADHLSST